MAESFPFTVRGRRRSRARLFRVAHRTLVESLYLLTAPITAAVGLLMVVGGLCAGAVGLLVPGGSGLCPARRHWRGGPATLSGGGSRGYAPRPPGREEAPAGAERRRRSAPGLWFDAAHAVAVLPVVLVTFVVTALWWFVGVAAATFPLRHPDASSGRCRRCTWVAPGPIST